MENTEKKNCAQLSEKELENVAGGMTIIETTMKCTCGHSEIWRGDYLDDNYYWCPNCHGKTLRGVTKDSYEVPHKPTVL